MKTNLASTFSLSNKFRYVLQVLALIEVVFCTAAQPVGNAGFAFEQMADRLVIIHSGLPVAHYVFKDTNIFRPYFAHVHTPDGIQVTRNHPPIAGQDAVDHPTMHPGIWLAFGDISGQDFWRNKATIRHERFVEPPAVHDGKLNFVTESKMITTNGESLAKLVSHFTLETLTDGYLLVWNAAFAPTTDTFTFGDQEEMGFGVRVATPITEKNGGVVENSDGVKGAKSAWGKTANWCDYSGIISNRLVGMAVMADPKNFRPSWFHSRDYGLLEANPFGHKAFTKGEPSSVPVAKGKTFQIRFGAFIHSSATNTAPDIAGAYKALTSTPEHPSAHLNP
jgi:Methane oxygenase PmoA